MKKLSAVSLLSISFLTACSPLPPLAIDTGAARALNTVDLRQPNVTLTFLSTGEKHKTEATFPPPKTIDCSRLRLEPDAFKDAIEAGALIVQIQAPPEAKHISKETTEVVKIKPTYSGVLALCKVSPRAIGPESRSYHLRSLDEYFIMGKDNLISVVGAELSQKPDQLEELLNTNTDTSFRVRINAGKKCYSWMLWLTDNLVIFPDYEAEVAAKRKTSMPKPASPVPAATKNP